MDIHAILNAIAGFLSVLVLAVSAQNTSENERPDIEPRTFLKSLTGTWTGTGRTWFQPGELADESDIRGEFTLILNGGFLRHSYKSMIQGKPRRGEETIAFNSVKNTFEISWMDDFHMSDAIMFSEGEATNHGFSVTGHYDVPDHPPWGWRTVYDLLDPDHLVITSYNITPDGQQAKAVEIKYNRKKQD